MYPLLYLSIHSIAALVSKGRALRCTAFVSVAAVFSRSSSPHQLLTTVLYHVSIFTYRYLLYFSWRFYSNPIFESLAIQLHGIVYMNEGELKLMPLGRGCIGNEH